MKTLALRLNAQRALLSPIMACWAYDYISINIQIFQIFHVKCQRSLQLMDILRTQTGRCAYSRTNEQHLILSILRCSARTLTFL